jgi:hypothetical protein
MLFKYADDTNTILPQNTDVSPEDKLAFFRQLSVFEQTNYYI